MPLTKTTNGYCIGHKEVTFKDGKKSNKYDFVDVTGASMDSGYSEAKLDLPICNMELDGEEKITTDSLKKNEKNQLIIVWAQKPAFQDQPAKWSLVSAVLKK